MDRVQLMKNETTALGGDDADTTPYPSPIAPQEDAIEAAGVYLQDVSNRDETTLLSRNGNDMTFKDGNNSGGLTLSQLVRNVSKVGTPVNNQLAVWTGDGTLEGESELTYDGTVLGITKLNLTGPIRMEEVAAPDGNIAGSGQIWCKDNTPNDLYFRDDSGVDHLLSFNEAEYAYLPGRTGGQTLYGGAEASQNLTLGSTSDATKGFIYLGAATAYDEVDVKLGLGILGPDTTLHVHAATAGSVVAEAGTVLTVENSTTAYISILTPNTATSGLLFGDPEDTNVGYITYDHSTDTMSFTDATTGTKTLAQLAADGVQPTGTPADSQIAVWTNATTIEGTSALTFDGTDLHVVTGSSGATPLAGTVLTVEHSTTAYVSLLTPNTATSGILFGDPDDNDVGQITYNHSTDTLSFTDATTGTKTLGELLAGGGAQISGTPADSQIAVWTGASAIEGTSALTFDGTDLHVSTGSSGATPQTGTVLTVENNSFAYISLLTPNTVASGIWFGDPEDNDGGRIVYQHSTDALSFATAGATRMTVDSTGLGVGTTSPDTLLHVEGTADPVLRMTSKDDLEGAGGTENIAAIEFEGLRSTRYDLTAAIRVRQAGTWSTVTANYSPGAIEFFTQDGSASDTLTTPRMTIGPTGLVGIGIDSPDTTLHVFDGTAGTVTAIANTVVTIENSTTAYLSFLTPNTATAGIMFADPDDNDIGAIKYDHSADSLTFRTGNGDRIIIDSIGRIGTGGETSPLGRVHIKGADVGAIAPSASADELILENNGDSGMTIYSAAASSGWIYFGDVDSDTVGNIRYNHSTDVLSFTDGTTGTKTLAELAAGGDVSASGTPANNQIAVWTDATTIEGDAKLTWDGTELYISHASGPAQIRLVPTTANAADSSRLYMLENDAAYGGYIKYDGAANVFHIGTRSASVDTAALSIARDTRNVTVTTGPLSLESTAVQFDVDGSNNLTFKDSVTGTKTLAELAAGVSASGTPADNQIAVWTNSTTIEGDADLTWDGTQLVVKPGGNPVIWLQNPTTAEASLSHDMDGIQLSAQTMDTSNKYTPAIKFMSTDANFTTTNPKMLAFIVGRATESYAADTDGGMALDFGVSHVNPGTTTVPDVGMTLLQPTSGGAHIGVGENATAAPRHLYARSSGEVYVRLDRLGDYVEMGTGGTDYCEFVNNGLSNGYRFDSSVTINGGVYGIISGTSNLTFHTSAGERMRVDGNGLGINETSPDTELHVTRTAGTMPSGGSSSTAIFQDNSTTGTFCILTLVSGAAATSRFNLGHASDIDAAYFEYSHLNQIWSWATASGALMTFDTSTGELDIDDPGAALRLDARGGGTTQDRTATITMEGIRETSDSGSCAEILMRDYANSTEYEGGAIRCVRTGASGNRLDFYTAANSSGATLEMTLDHTGYLGLGESDPTYPFQVGANSSELFYVTTAGAVYIKDDVTINGDSMLLSASNAAFQIYGRTGGLGTGATLTMVGHQTADDQEICDVAFRNYVASEFEIANITAMVGPTGGGGDWGRLRLRALQDGSYTGDVNVLGDARLWVQYDDEYTTMAQSMAGLQLCSYSLDTTNKFTPAVQFGAYNSAIHQSPKTTAWIVGRATEAWSASTDSGMAMDFLVSTDDAGASPAGTRKMIIDFDGVIIGQYQGGLDALSTYETTLASLRVWGAGDPAIEIAHGGTAGTGILQFNNTNFATVSWQAIQFGDHGDGGDADIGYIRYDHADNTMTFYAAAAFAMTFEERWSTRVVRTTKLLSQRDAQSSNHTVGDQNNITAEESGRVYHNTGLGSKNYHNLPTAAAGLHYTFVNLTANDMNIQAATGDTIRIGTSVSASNGTIDSTSVGATVTLVAMDSTQWVAVSYSGSWTVT